ncbi:MAG: type II toxin-antitoxin system RelE/ParE family toxin [Candidatus Electrothrix scaldis]|nr:MAG: type II toxin-antitoxin system RelE/ParE family toxin [Candidatus Electrothrix sp. GW3-3]
MDYNIPMNTVVELPEFIRRAEKLLRNPERENLIRYLAANPEAGVLLQGTGGIRKLRWKCEGAGKSGGVRVIYYFHSEQYPLFLLTLFGKSEKANISKAERNMLAKLTEELLATYGSKQRGGVR